MMFRIYINNQVFYFLFIIINLVKKINDVKNISDVSEEYDAENYRLQAIKDLEEEILQKSNK